MRQYGEVPPWLSSAAAPAVTSTSGLGTGGGAGVFSEDGQGFGRILVNPGKSPSASGNVVITFPATPPLLFIAPSDPDDFGTFTVTNNDGAHTSITLSWTGAKLVGGKKYTIAYEWNVSK